LSIIHDNRSGGDKRLLDKAQLSASEVILGCYKTTFSYDVRTDLNIPSFRPRRERSMFRYFSKLIFHMMPCLFLACMSRSLKEIRSL